MMYAYTVTRRVGNVFTSVDYPSVKAASKARAKAVKGATSVIMSRHTVT